MGRRRPAPSQPDAWRKWHVPLSQHRTTLEAAYGSLSSIALRQREVPLLVQLVENPRFDLPGIEIFSGATNLRTHDYLHILLGRGLLPKDEAFVLGFTMGSTNRVGAVHNEASTTAAHAGREERGRRRPITPNLISSRPPPCPGASML